MYKDLPVQTILRLFTFVALPMLLFVGLQFSGPHRAGVVVAGIAVLSLAALPDPWRKRLVLPIAVGGVVGLSMALALRPDLELIARQMLIVLLVGAAILLRWPGSPQPG